MKRGDPKVTPEIVARLDDDQEVVRYTAAGAVIRLGEIKPQPVSANKHPK